MAADELVVHGAGAQPQGHHRPAARNALICITGCPGRQVQPGLRHDLCGRAAPPVESLSAYARQFLQMMETRRRLDRRTLARDLDRPEDDLTEPRSTVGTVTEIYDICGCSSRAWVSRTARSAAARSPGSRSRRSSTRCSGCRRGQVHRERAGRPRPQEQGRLRAPACRGFHPGEGRRGAASARRGVERDKKFKHTIEVVVDRLVMKEDLRTRLAQSIETAVATEAGRDRHRGRRGGDLLRRFACPEHGVSLPELRADLLVQLAARSLPAVHRPGCAAGIDPDLLVPTRRCRRRGAGAVVGRQLQLLRVGDPGVAERWEIDLDKLAELSSAQQDLFLYGTGRAHLHPVPQPDGAQALVHAQPGIVPVSNSATARPIRRSSGSGSRSTCRSAPARRAAAPAEARGAGGHGRRPQHGSRRCR